MLKYILAFLVIAGIWTAWAILKFAVEAPYIPTWVPIVVTAVTVLIIVAIILVRVIKARRAASQLEKALADQAAQHARSARPDQQANVAEIQREFENALAALKQSKLGKNALYALPWELIIGPPGAGKSTALRNSGLNFPYQSKGAVKGVSGTRNCDWWFTNEAVILDTAGRWTTGEEDRDEWLGFLDLLKKFRGRKPLNGIIATISLSDLGGASEDEAINYAQQVRDRIDEAQRQLQMSLPVYVLFTKSDLIPGFVETFGDLSKNDRGQIWGFTVPVTQDVDPTEHFDSRFDQLLNSLEKRQLRRMGDERRLETREMIYIFPRQLDVLRTNLRSFVGQLFEENLYGETPVFRGVYFTSGTQEGRPIDRVMTRMADAFGIQSALPIAQVKEPKSYFLRDMFREVVFKDADLAVRSKAELQRQRRIRYIVAMALLVLALLLLTFPVYAYFQNRGLLNDTQDVVSGFQQQATKVPADRPVPPAAVADLEKKVDHLKGRRVWHPSEGFGMYQGNEVRDPLAYYYHKNALRDRVIAPLFQDLTTELALFSRSYATRPPPLDAYQRNHDRLRDYLLLTRVPEGEKQPPLDTGDLKQRLTDDLARRWAKELNVPPEGEQFEKMKGHVGDYLDALPDDPRLAFDRQDTLVKTVRRVLDQADTTALALQELKREFSPENGYRDLSLYDLIGTGNGPWIKASTNPDTNEPWSVPAVFTRDIWDLHISKRLTSGTPLNEVLPWVVGNEAIQDTKQAREEMRQDVREQYFKAYSDAWWDFHRNIYTITPSGEDQTFALLTALTAGQETPLHMLFRGFDYHLTLPEPEPETPDTTEAQSGLLDQAGQELQRTKFGKGRAARLARAGARGLKTDPTTGRVLEEPWSATKVYDRMEPFISFGYVSPPPPQEGQPPPPPAKTPLDAYEERLGYLRKAYQDFRDDNSKRDALSDSVQEARTEIRDTIDRQETRFKLAFDNLLWPPVKGASNTHANTLAKGAGLSWCAAVVEPHDTTVDGRYPFERHGHDMSFDDFLAFYAPTGTLWTFYDEALKTYIRREGNDFEWNRRLGKSQAAVFHPELQQFLERSWDITHVFFPPGAEEPRVDFDLRIRPHPQVAVQQVTIGGKLVEYHNGPEEWHRYSWPGEDAGAGALIEIRGADGMHERIEQQGEWGLFHILEEGTVLSGAGRIFTVVWHLRTHDVDITIDFRPVREDTPFYGVVGRSRAPRLLHPLRTTHLDPPRDITASGRITCPRRPAVVAANTPRGS